MRHNAETWSGKTSEAPTFPMGLQAETASQNSTSEWDAFSGRSLKWKPHPRIRNGIEAQFVSARAATLTAT